MSMIALAAALLAAAPEPAPAPAPIAPVAAAETMSASNAEAQRYCVLHTPTGSLIERKACHTRAEWVARGTDPLAPR